MQKGFVSIWLIAGLVIAALVVGRGYWIYKTQVQKSRVFHDQYGMPIITPSKAPETNNKPTPDTKPQNDQTANWKTYTSDKFNFSFKYPEDIFKYSNPVGEGQVSRGFLSIQFATDDLSFNAKGLPKLSMYINVSTSSGTLEDDIKSLKSNVKNISQVVATLDRSQGYRIYEFPTALEAIPNISSDSTYVQKNNLLYSISFTSSNADLIRTNKQTFDQILSTFKFI